MSEDNRREPRDSVFLRANMHGEAIERLVTVRNLSANGAMVQGCEALEVGAEVSLQLINIGTVKGTVAWIEGAFCGIQFCEPIDHRMARRQVSSEDFGRASLFVIPPKRPV